ncbi:MAG TPA: response regulator transcription factor [Microbacterium sp.]|uniref:response regulator transcription factor n=1 Tax=Microbacterium sp. TaxID=51671 RepID=UPI002B45D82D|nr:response regulator transcription factor [Microbacterium sp.]HKT56633.1 response regulator transcription factor [Microbacterium sp.]
MIRILLVDDHPVLRHGIVALLGTQPDLEVVAEAGAADDAASMAEAYQPDVALVDLDLGAEQPTGFDATRGILRASPKTKTLIFTAYDSDADIVRAIDAGAVGYLVKDSRPADLFSAIRSAASGDSALGGLIGARLMDRLNSPDDTLTARELEVLTLAASGLSNRDLAGRLLVSEATVKTHLHHAYLKLGADNRQTAVATAVKRGLIRL